MDLVTLVTACALGVEPKLMHALVWHQSGGEPWAVAVQNERMPRVYSSMQEAISEAHAISIPNDTVRVGLAGLPVSRRTRQCSCHAATSPSQRNGSPDLPTDARHIRV
jgi:hypothetical protein